LDDIGEEEAAEAQELEQKEELPGMSEDDSEPGIMPISNNASLKNPSTCTVNLRTKISRIKMSKNLIR
jgi:hypothetical protein